MSDMKAVRIEGYGGVDVLKFGEAPRPVPGPGEVLIHAQAASVNPFDCAARAGYVAGWFSYTFPLILGLDVAGQVTETGPGVTQFHTGDAVYARLSPARNGAYAEYVLAQEDEVARMPKSLEPLQAAAIPHAALTAWAMLDAANLSAGQTVLVHGAAGGVGHLAVQLARIRGLNVIGTASGRNQEFLRQLGVSQAVDYTVVPFESAARNVDAVFDTVGGETQQRSFAVLKKGGALVSIVQPPSQETADQYGIQQQFISFTQPGGALLAQIASLLHAGQLKVTVSKVLPLAEIQSAHSQVEQHHTRGKLVLEIANGRH